MALVLYQFPFSHFCEKTRWHLDARGLRYRTRDLVPGLHRRTARRLGAPGSVPFLVDGDHVLGDSSDIAAHIERGPGGRALVPADPAARTRVLELEQRFDETIGPDLRLVAYSVMLDHRAVIPFWRGYYPLPARVALTVAGAAVSRGLRAFYRIDAASAGAARDRLDAQLDALDAQLGDDPTRYLVGDGLTLADITAASLLAPAVGPPSSPWASSAALPRPLIELRAEARSRPIGAWVLERYRRDRPPRAA